MCGGTVAVWAVMAVTYCQSWRKLKKPRRQVACRGKEFNYFRELCLMAVVIGNGTTIMRLPDRLGGMPLWMPCARSDRRRDEEGSCAQPFIRGQWRAFAVQHLDQREMGQNVAAAIAKEACDLPQR